MPDEMSEFDLWFEQQYGKADDPHEMTFNGVRIRAVSLLAWNAAIEAERKAACREDE